jgi:hypothetical protein
VISPELLFAQVCFGYLGSFWFPYDFYDLFSVSVKKAMGF